jgi:hypothetical protein
MIQSPCSLAEATLAFGRAALFGSRKLGKLEEVVVG